MYTYFHTILDGVTERFCNNARIICSWGPYELRFRKQPEKGVVRVPYPQLVKFHLSEFRIWKEFSPWKNRGSVACWLLRMKTSVT